MVSGWSRLGRIRLSLRRTVADRTNSRHPGAQHERLLECDCKGRASPNVTLAIYSHALEANELAAAKFWENAMAELIVERDLGKSRPRVKKPA